MVETGKRSMKKKAIKTPSKNSTKYFRGKNSKKKCSITKKVLAGVTHDEKKAKKQSKTQKRPNVPFGGILSSKAREKVFIETGKVAAGVKKIDEIDQKYRKFVVQIIGKIK